MKTRSVGVELGHPERRKNEANSRFSKISESA